MKLDIIAFTSRGAALAGRLKKFYPESSITAPKKYNTEDMQALLSLHDWTKSNFILGKTLVFIGALGIAIRAITPFLKDKVTDAAVLCIDESGENIIPMLCGHIGGANQTAKEIAEMLGGRAIITTATDLNGIFSVDEWASKNNCLITNPHVIKNISAALLDGEDVGIKSDFDIMGELPRGITTDAKTKLGIEISLRSTNPFPTTLHIIPRIIVAGIGCRKDVSNELLEKKVYQTLSRFNIPVEAVGMIATIDLKTNEPALLALRGKLNLEFKEYSAEELMSAPGEFDKSEIVLRVTGTDNVCQRAVVCSGAKLFTGKIAEDGVAVALGKLDWSADFTEVSG